MGEKPVCWVGFDTSNYTTSVAVAIQDDAAPCGISVVANLKTLLPVPPGGRGLRQSEAVFAHVKNLPAMVDTLGRVLSEGGYRVAAVGYSARPRDAADSYMPCFLEGAVAAGAFAAGCGAPVYAFSHQSGHIAAAMFGAGLLTGSEKDGIRFPNRPLLAFHVSGGTTEAVLVRPRQEDAGTATPGGHDGRGQPLAGGFSVEIVGGSADLHAGQVIDRAGVMMGLPFPCGPALEALAASNQRKLPPIKLSVKDGLCNLSGVENQAAKLWQETADAPLVSAFVLTYVGRTLRRMTDQIQQKLAGSGDGFPVLYAGGVMSNRLIRPLLREGVRWETHFAPPAYAADNAAGVALLCAGSSWQTLHAPLPAHPQESLPLA